MREWGRAMSTRALLITLRLVEGRYHGVPEWPPSPFRLFQALVAGALTGAPATRATALAPAFEWLESLESPTIAAPASRPGRWVRIWVPNNNRDWAGGDRRRLDKLRTAKNIQPRLLAGDAPFLYVWDAGERWQAHADAIVNAAERLYQLGRGIDMAFATAKFLLRVEAGRRLAEHSGSVHRPFDGGTGGYPLHCPAPGSYRSLCERHRAQRERFRKGTLRQPPPPRYRVVTYDSVPARLLFDLMSGDGAPRFQPVAQWETSGLAERIRDRLAEALCRGADAALVERVVLGRGAGEHDKAQRIRIIPIPSIGFAHADRAIRRVLVEVPPDCPIPAREVEWAAGCVHLGMDRNGVLTDPMMPQLVRASDVKMLAHYGIEEVRSPDSRATYRVWRTVTPAVLPERAARRRIDPERIRLRGEQKGSAERGKEERRAAAAVRDALRHAGVGVPVTLVLVQREAFEQRGERAERFARGTRFPKERLWHVEVTFARPLAGPLVIGDGRFLGLGVMAPDRRAWRDVIVFRVRAPSPIPVSERAALVEAARRALMSRARDGHGGVPYLFSGHSTDGGPARSGRHRHVFIAAEDIDGDGLIERLVIAAPWACDRSMSRRVALQDRALFDRTVGSFEEIRAGRLGVVALGEPRAPNDGDPLIGPARAWTSRTIYRATRHAARGETIADTICRDLKLECRRRGLPVPEVEVLRTTAGPNGGHIAARVHVRFSVAVRGPLLLGQDSHAGGGLLAAEGLGRQVD